MRKLSVTSPQLKTIRLLIIGFGNIGRNLAQMILNKKQFIETKHHIRLIVTGIIDIDYNLIDHSNKGINLEEILSLKKAELLHRSANLSFTEILETVPFDIAVELTPSTPDGQPGLQHMIAVMNAKKHLVTSNKSPLVLKYPELATLASQNGCAFRFEATVAGVIPIFTAVRDGLSANEILKIEGIFNGTTNYILTRMSEGVPYTQALEDAKKLGFCETNPHDDISGLDAARKLVIIANVLLGSHLTLNDVHREGIDTISQAQIIESHLNNQTIKHIAYLEITPQGIRASVQPQSINLSNPLAHVNGIMNGIHILTRYAGEITFFGIGAGPKEVSTIILSDILSIGKKISELIPIDLKAES
ncbi:MAG: homoserine dehydrogenase [Candidatus Helarchaeota archaeon]